MAENHGDDPVLTRGMIDSQEASDGFNTAQDSTEEPGRELLHTSLEDTGESSLLQEQEGQFSQNNDAARVPLKLQKPSAKAMTGTKEAVNIALADYQREMNDYLTWKENLRITSVDLQIGGPYFDLWTKEANLFFRRLVILRKRIESIKKQKRA